MIGRICGTLLEKQVPTLLVDVQGVAYEIQVSLNTFFELPDEGQQVQLVTHFAVREDAQVLFGFSAANERQLFRALIKVNGVGPKLALAILSGVTVSDFVRCVQTNDSAALVRLPGVGKKTAERLLVEMRDRLADWETPRAALNPDRRVEPGRAQLVQDAESALLSLGYKPQEAARMVNAALPEGEGVPSSETLIRMALKSVVKK